MTAFEERRLQKGLSLAWREIAETGIEVFYDSTATLYRIDGQIYAVPRLQSLIHQESD
jgi:hypothetical protein